MSKLIEIITNCSGQLVRMPNVLTFMSGSCKKESMVGLNAEQINLVREAYIKMRWKTRTTAQDSEYKAGEKIWKQIKSVVFDMMNKIYGMDTVAVPILSPAATGIFYYILLFYKCFNFYFFLL